MTTRRHLLGLIAGSAAFIAAPGLRAQAPPMPRPKLGEDGMYHFDWYLESFLDIPEEITAASANGKRLVVMWGLKGCPACKRMHETHLMDAPTVAYIRQHFEVLHLNILGAREVTSPDGRKRPEKALAEAEAVRSTPTLQFMPEKVDGRRESARLAELPDVQTFRAMFQYVAEKGYDNSAFVTWLKARA
jgi:thioredoxin-related protein